MVNIRSKAIRTVLRWQLIATVAMAFIAGLSSGAHGALSAIAGGLISFIAGLGFAIVASMSRAEDAGGALLAALRAEAVKIGLIVILLWAVLATYKFVVVLAFFGSFAVTVALFAAAVFVHED